MIEDKVTSAREWLMKIFEHDLNAYKKLIGMIN